MIERLEKINSYLEEYLTPVESLIRYLTLLEKSEFTFYLTGSRHFGGWSQLDDWDFFTEHNEEVENYLESIGFIVNESKYDYLDPTISKVYTWSKKIRTIDVQICNDIKTKIQIEKIIKDNFKDIGLPKNRAQKIAISTMVYNLLKNNK